MTQEQIQTAYNILTRQGPPAAGTYLSSVGKSLDDFADVLFEQNKINQDQYFKICGKYPPPPPDPQREKAYAEWANALANNQLTIHQIFGAYPYADDQRYHQDASNWARTNLNNNGISDSDIKILYQKGILTEAEIQSAFNNVGRAHEVSTVLGKPKPLVEVRLPTETQMLPDRNDVLLIGNRAAGKTMFLGSFLHYLQEQIGGVRILGEVMGAFDYAQKLIAAVAQNS